MPLSRRTFVKTASVGSLGAMTLPMIGARGAEASRELAPEPVGFAPGGIGHSGFAYEERGPYRIAAPHALRLDSNENPNGPGRAVLEAIRGQFIESPRYPDTAYAELQLAIAGFHNVTPENVLIGCGSGEILRMASYAFTSAERALVTGAPSFEDPVRHSEMMKAPIRAIPVDTNLRLDLGGMAAASNGAGMVFLCNPNNPTATVHGATAIESFVGAVNSRSPDTIILIDEAYHEYVDDPTYRTALPLALSIPSVVLVRTFSKVYGMAGLRVGYAIAHPDLIARMQRHRLPNSLNVLGAAAAMATLPDAGHLERERQANRAARDFTRRAFEQMGFRCSDSQTNFLMIAIGRDSRGFKDACAKHGVLVGRAFPPLTTHARVSIGTMDEMKHAVAVFRQVLSGAAN